MPYRICGVLGSDDPERRDAEAEHVDDDQARDRPEDVGVDRGQDADREEDRTGQAAQDGHHQPEDEDEDLGDDEELDIDQERVDQARQRVPEDLAVQERRLDTRPAGAVDDDPPEDAEDGDRAGERDEAGADRAPVDPAEAGAAGARHRVGELPGCRARA